MFRFGLSIAFVLTFLAMGSCRSPVQREVDQAVTRVEQAGERMLDRSDRTIGAALYRFDQTAASTQVLIRQEVDNIKSQYSSALTETSKEVSELREEFKADLLLFEGRVEERIEQMRSSALEVVAETDKATQARIDQVFTELRLFMKETLAEIRLLIEPVLGLAITLQEAVGKGNEHIAKISEKIIELIEQIQEVFKEVKAVLHQVQGENEQGEKVEVPMTEIIIGLLAAFTALITAVVTRLQRSSERKRPGERWMEEEIEKLVTMRVAEILKEGVLDDEIMGVLTRADLVKTEPNGGFKA